MDLPRAGPRCREGGGRSRPARSPRWRSCGRGPPERGGHHRCVPRSDAAGRDLASIEFKQRLGSIIASIETILKLIEESPRDIRRARKFLKVYLEGAQRITDQYARTHGHVQSAELEHNFRTLLVDMENTCNEQHQKLLQNDLLDLDVQIEVLSTRLRQEGVP